jgi:hypothetical protein
MKFGWDRFKAAQNLRKHGVSFDEAATVFGDSLAITYPDFEHSFGESRFLTYGHSAQGRLIVVVA